MYRILWQNHFKNNNNLKTHKRIPKFGEWDYVILPIVWCIFPTHLLRKFRAQVQSVQPSSSTSFQITFLCVNACRDEVRHWGVKRGISPVSVWTSGLFTAQDSALRALSPTYTHTIAITQTHTYTHTQSAAVSVRFRCHRGKIAGTDCHGNKKPRHPLLGAMPDWPGSVCMCVWETERGQVACPLPHNAQLSVFLPAWQTGRVC